GTWSFTEQSPDDLRGFDRPLAVSILSVIHSALFNLDERSVRAGLGNIDEPLVIPKAVRLSRHGVLTPEDGFLLSRVDGTATARQVLDIIPGDRVAAERRLLGLLWTEAVVYRPRAEAPPRPVRS